MPAPRPSATSATKSKMPALVLQHDAAFGPGRVLPVLRDFGIPVDFRRLDQGDEVPRDLDEVRLIVSLGGAMRLADEPAWLGDELAALKSFSDADRPILGFGLGAQLFAKAAGGEVRENRTGDDDSEPAPQFGFLPIKLPFPGGTDPIVFGLAEGSPMFFWHRDTFELPKLPPPPDHDPNKKGPPPPTGNALISSSPAAKNAGFRFKNRGYGFQWHPELGPEDVARVLNLHGEGHDVAAIRSDLDKFGDRYARLGTRLLQNFVQFLKAY